MFIFPFALKLVAISTIRSWNLVYILYPQPTNLLCPGQLKCVLALNVFNCHHFLTRAWSLLPMCNSQQTWELRQMAHHQLRKRQCVKFFPTACLTRQMSCLIYKLRWHFPCSRQTVSPCCWALLLVWLQPFRALWKRFQNFFFDILLIKWWIDLPFKYVICLKIL